MILQTFSIAAHEQVNSWKFLANSDQPQAVTWIARISPLLPILLCQFNKVGRQMALSLNRDRHCQKNLSKGKKISERTGHYVDQTLREKTAPCFREKMMVE